MRITRSKKARKIMSFYCNNYGFRKPFQILIDGTFCLAGYNENINISEQMKNDLTDNIRLLTTKCIIIEFEEIAKKSNSAVIMLKQCQLFECNHKEVVGGANCILSMIQDNKDNHFIIGTQDRDLQYKLSRIAGVPLLYIYNKMAILNRPSTVSLQKAKNDQKIFFSDQLKSIKQLIKTSGLEEPPIVFKKKRKNKAPNPLSCKKKKAIPITDKPHSSTTNKKSRKRNKKKI